MYAVFVIAAILLSASPMHVRTLLAALPAVSPGHQFTSDDQDQDQKQGQRAASPHVPSATRAAAHISWTADSLQVIQTVVAPKPAPKVSASDAGLLEHAPNAP